MKSGKGPASCERCTVNKFPERPRTCTVVAKILRSTRRIMEGSLQDRAFIKTASSDSSARLNETMLSSTLFIVYLSSETFPLFTVPFLSRVHSSREPPRYMRPFYRKNDNSPGWIERSDFPGGSWKIRKLRQGISEMKAERPNERVTPVVSFSLDICRTTSEYERVFSISANINAHPRYRSINASIVLFSWRFFFFFFFVL